MRLQNLMEGLCHDLRKQERKRDAHAGGFWQAALLNKPFYLDALLGPLLLASQRFRTALLHP